MASERNLWGTCSSINRFTIQANSVKTGSVRSKEYSLVSGADITYWIA